MTKEAPTLEPSAQTSAATGADPAAIHLAEYAALKAEQASRIGFRDNLLYVTLGVVGGLGAYALGDPTHVPALLLVPWACFLLGWTYVANDQKISAIGRYLRDDLAARIGALGADRCFGWESVHRGDRYRRARKLQQLLVDLTAFCFSAATALLVFYRLQGTVDPLQWLLMAAGGLLTLVLAGWIWGYADFGSD